MHLRSPDRPLLFRMIRRARLRLDPLADRLGLGVAADVDPLLVAQKS
jgi:hypothetical protein